MAIDTKPITDATTKGAQGLTDLGNALKNVVAQIDAKFAALEENDITQDERLDELEAGTPPVEPPIEPPIEPPVEPPVQPPVAYAHGQQVKVAGRALGVGLPGYSATMTTKGATTYSADTTVSNVKFTGEVVVTGGNVAFQYCSFEHAPAQGRAALLQYNGGQACGTVSASYCDFDSGLRGAQGTFESCGFQAGQRGSANPGTIGKASSFKLYRCRIEGFGNYIGYHKFQNNLCEVTECLMQNGTTGGGSHTDGIEIYSSDNIKLLRCRITLPSTATQSNINITPMDISMPNPGKPVRIEGCYINGGRSPVLTRPTSATDKALGFPRNVSYVDNRYGDLSEYDRECDFNSMKVTFDEAWSQTAANQPVIYWAKSNVWAPDGEGVTKHTKGAFIDESNFFGGEVWIWNGSVVGPTTPPVTPPVEPPVEPPVTTGWPDATNTGYKNAPGYPGSLTPFTGSLVANTKYSFKDFPDSCFVTVPGVTFFGCRFQSNSVDFVNVDLKVPATLEYCTICPKASLVAAPPNAAWPSAGAGKAVDGNGGYAPYMCDGTKGYQFGIIMRQGGVAKNCDIWGFGNAVTYYGSGQKDLINCWIHDAANPSPKGYHTDGPGYLDGGSAPDNILIKTCTIASLGNTNGIALQAGTGYTNVVIDGCFISGFGATVDLCHSDGAAQNIKFINNVIATDIRSHWGPIYSQDCSSVVRRPGGQWKNNKFRVLAGTAPSSEANLKFTAADDGKFIHPNSTLSATDWAG
jgi:hypothetical protein